MYPVRPRWYGAALLISILTASTGVSALQVKGNVGVDMRYTDNAALAPFNESDDLITTGSIGASVSEDQGPVTGNANAAFRYVDYLDDTFDNQDYLNLGASAGWEQIRNVLRWNLDDYFSQTAINTLEADTPSNTENINVINLAVQWTIRPADRHKVTVTPSFADYYYEISPTDNQQTGLAASWSYQFRPTVAISLNGAYRDVAYDDDTLGADNTNSNVNVGIAISRSRSQYAASVGASKVDRDSGGGSDGFVARLTALYKLGTRSTIDANVSTDITDTSNAYLDSSVDPNAGNFGNIQTSSDVLRNSLFRVAYNRNGTTLDFSAWVELRDLNYQTTPNDRKVQEYGTSFGYNLSPRMTATVGGRYIETKEENLMITEKYSQADGQLGYALSRKLNAHAGVRFQTKNSTLPQNEFDEFSVFAGLGYLLGR